MPATTRWAIAIPTGQPVMARLGGIVMSLVASLCIAGAALMLGVGPFFIGLSALAACLLGVGWLRHRWRRLPSNTASQMLTADIFGAWKIGPPDQQRFVVPVRVWYGPFWMTLVLVPQDGARHARPLAVTVWRSTVPTEAWRKLCILLRARFGRGARGEIAEAA